MAQLLITLAALAIIGTVASIISVRHLKKHPPTTKEIAKATRMGIGIACGISIGSLVGFVLNKLGLNTQNGLLYDLNLPCALAGMFIGISIAEKTSATEKAGQTSIVIENNNEHMSVKSEEKPDGQTVITITQNSDNP